ncbi:MAG: sigma-54-dependent Fis family transcriptional regulator [Spirochaetes bacterium GWD1_27_9]|nr:MAG: sigma-54-dependent Fis family transcriptional regulator [Spirochaetes bacterium GWB1_27_13]OHD44389.1 MAG: sigma-54-dependent Fis family transcriptional regulator [Spirochaetes bacterium GWD1_27_9]
MQKDEYGFKELSILFEISKKLDDSMDLKEVLPPVLKIMANFMDMHLGTVTILNRETKEIVIEEAYGLSPEQRARGRYKLGEGITGKVVETGEPTVVKRVSDESKFLDKTKAREQLNKKDISFICVPIKLGKEVVGTLSFDRYFVDDTTLENDLKLVTLIASLIAQAVKLRQKTNEEIENLKAENTHLQNELKNKFNPSNIIGNSKAMKEIYSFMENILDNKTTVLIRGESGVGKELVAHAIHYNGIRANKPFVKVNCAALPENLIESELFGHEKGAFTGAINKRKGRFEISNGGTIFLDEIGDFPMATQIKLLRVIQEREFERIGGGEIIKIDVRIICATNRDLEKLIEEGKFRQDLYYRINVFPIYVPALRERKDDIILLADYFLEKYAKINNKNIKRISTQAIDMLVSYHWPGNVRELENCIERAVVLCSDGVIHGYNLPPSLQLAETTGTTNIGKLESVVNTVEKDMIIDAIKLTNGNLSKAAKILDITERMIGIRINKYNIDVGKFKSYTNL